jgi:hypothetical protein
MAEKRSSVWLPEPALRLARRVLDALARRLPAEPTAGGEKSTPPAAMTIRLDYAFSPRPRWGRAWGLPTHAALEAIIRRSDASARGALEAIARHAATLRRIPARAPEEDPTPRWVNGYLPGLDGAAIYGFIREHRPATYWEVGSGNSTRFARRAIADGGLATRIVSVDPSPRADIDRLCDEVIRAPLEEVSPGLAARLAPGDMCFIDCSHRAFQNSDVTVAMLETLPALAPDVLVGFHDIFLPDDYPPAWAKWYFNEQYLLAMFLLGGHAGMEIVLPAWDASRRPALAAIVAPIWEGDAFVEVERHGDAFWLRSLPRC